MRSTPQGKSKHFFTPDHSSHYVFAGLWESWLTSDLQVPLISATILTTAATGHIANIHDRMPVIVPRQKWKDWLLFE